MHIYIYIHVYVYIILFYIMAAGPRSGHLLQRGLLQPIGGRPSGGETEQYYLHKGISKLVTHKSYMCTYICKYIYIYI